MYNEKIIESLSEEQIRELAMFAKSLLDDTGLTSTITQLNDIISGIVATRDDMDQCLLLTMIQKAYLNLNERAAGEGKTLYGLTGVKFDNDFYGMDKREEL